MSKQLTPIRTKTVKLLVHSAIAFFVFMFPINLNGRMGSALAETVLVTSQSGNKGHAWLFSARGKLAGFCWLVVPKHVIAVGEDNTPMSFTFIDRSGRGGESGRAVVVGNIVDGVSTTMGEPDLAFARVKIGRGKGGCKSHLGLPTHTYQTVLRMAPKLLLENHLSKSFGLFYARIVRVSMDKVAGGIIQFQPIRKKDAISHLKQGLSGAVAKIQYQGQVYPFAMVLQAERRDQFGFALRFDLIREAFSSIKHTKVNEEKQINSDFTILSFNAKSVDNKTGPSSLIDPGSCWTISPRPDQKQMSVTIVAGKMKNGISGITLLRSEKCGAKKVKFWIDQRIDSNSQWTRVTNCMTSMFDTNRPGCHLDFWGARQLRIVIDSKVPVSLSMIKVY